MNVILLDTSGRLLGTNVGDKTPSHLVKYMG
jgi:hypothetical protein